MIYIIITTCINNKFGIIDNYHRENRKKESIGQLLNLIENDNSIKPIIVENNGFRDTFLDNFNCDICYTNNNLFNFNNKAHNELLDIKEVILRYGIQEDDIIIKMTGRYKLLDSSFINLIKANIEKYDAYVKFFNVFTQTYMVDDCVLGLFALKCKYIKDFNYESKTLSPESEFAIYIRNNANNLMEIEHLNLECCFADDLSLLVV
jgi:hypothetical protein